MAIGRNRTGSKHEGISPVCFPVIGSTLLTLFVLLSGGCKTKTGAGYEKTPEVPGGPGAGATADEPGGLALIKKEELISRGKVHAIRLDSADFRISGLRIGVQTFLRYATPVITFEMPKDSDYVEILRCPSEVIVDGGADTLENVELGSASLETETAVYQRNNFWESAASASGCVLIATSYTDISFEDTFSPTGAFHYYMRACVDEERLEGTSQFSTSHCSRLVSRSPVHKHYNKRSQDEMAALQKAADLRSKIDTLNRRIVETTMYLNTQLYDCQERHQTKVVSTKKHKAIAGILAGVTALGIPAIAALTSKASRALSAAKAGVVGLGAAAVLSNLYVAGSQSAPGLPRDAAACYNSDSTKELASQIRGQNPTSSSDQALLCSCAGALSAQTELYTLAVDLKNLLKLQQSYLDQAESVQASDSAPSAGEESGNDPDVQN